MKLPVRSILFWLLPLVPAALAVAVVLLIFQARSVAQPQSSAPQANDQKRVITEPCDLIKFDQHVRELNCGEALMKDGTTRAVDGLEED